MPDPSKLLLLDIFHLTLLMLGLGVIAYALIRQSNPLIRWHEHGNVWTDPFDAIDLLVVGILIGWFYYFIRMSALAEVPASAALENGAGLGQAILFQILAWSVLIAGLIFLLTYVRGVDVGELFGLARLRIGQIILWAVGFMVVTFPIVLLVFWGWSSLLENAFNSKPEQQELVKAFRNNSDVLTKILIAFSACVVAPITEEVLFRGFFYPVLKRFSERFFAAICVSLLFAVIHGSPVAVIPLAVLAMSFTIAYELTGCLLVPIAMHAMFNTTQIILMFTQ